MNEIFKWKFCEQHFYMKILLLIFLRRVTLAVFIVSEKS